MSPDMDPDEAVWTNGAQVDDDPDLESVVRAQLDGHGVECHGTVRIVSARIARAARERIEDEREEGGYNIRRAERERERRVKAEAEEVRLERINDQMGKALTATLDRAENAEAEVERLRAGIEALASTGEADGRGNSRELARRLRALLNPTEGETDVPT